MENEKDHSLKRLLIGIVILLVGTSLLARNFGIITPQFGRYIFNWRMLIIVVGLINLSAHKDKTPGIILLFIGGALYLPYVFDFHFNFWHLFWPLMLIIAGVMLIFRKNAFGPCMRLEGEFNTSDYIDEVNIFGGNERMIQTNSFKGGRITCIFGGNSLSLSRCQLAPGKQVIDLFAVFGGTKLVLPDDWNVSIQVVSIFGGFKDGRITRNIATTDSELVIKGYVLFGGGEIKSF